MSAAITAPTPVPLWQLALDAREHERRERAAHTHAVAVARGRLGGTKAAAARAALRRHSRARRLPVRSCARCGRAGALFEGPACGVCWRRGVAAGSRG